MKPLNEAASSNFERVLKSAFAELSAQHIPAVFTVTITNSAAKKVEKLYQAGTPKHSQLDEHLKNALVNIIQNRAELNENHHRIKQGLGAYKNVWSDDMLRNFNIMYNIDLEDNRTHKVIDNPFITVLYVGDHPGNPAYSF